MSTVSAARSVRPPKSSPVRVGNRAAVNSLRVRVRKFIRDHRRRAHAPPLLPPALHPLPLRAEH